MDGTYYVAAGFYASEGDVFPSVVLNTTGSKAGLGDLVAYVKNAVAYARENGREKALAVFNDPKGGFVRGDLFVWAESMDGTVLADPFWKTGIGKNFIDFSDPNGMKTTKVGIAAMRNGTGFSHTLFQDTAANGTAWVPKLVYMKAVDDSWWIGGGVYGVEVTG